MARPAIPVLFLSLVAALALAAPASASSVASARTTVASPAGTVNVSAKVTRFVQRRGALRAVSNVTATVTGITGVPTQSVTRRVVLQVAPGRTCRVLRLVINPINLSLLGLNVRLSRVVLTITANRRGGILGQLLCSLTNTRVANAAAVRSANRTLAKRPLSVMRFGVPANAQAAQAGTCTILNLVLGPIDLRLLGLRVHLNRVRLLITANPAGGILGSLLCGLANRPVPPLPVPGV
jgi:hypothetical protein